MNNSRGQSAGDGANQYGAGKELNITNNTTNNYVYGSDLTRADAEVICREVLDSSLPAITAAALEVFRERGERFTLGLIERVLARDSSLLGRMADPRIQVAISSAQTSFGETGDEDLGALLGNIIADMMSEPVRTHKEQLLRQCIDCAPRLSKLQINLIQATAILTVKYYSKIIDASVLLAALNEALAPYYGLIPDDYYEVSYIESIGVGSFLEVTAAEFGGKHDAYTHIHSSHPHSLCTPFAESELPSGIKLSDVIERVVSNDQSEAALIKYLPKPEMHEELNLARKRGNTFGGRQSGSTPVAILADFLVNQSINENQLENLARESYPELATFLDEITRIGAMRFKLGAVGLALADQGLALRESSTSPLAETEDSEIDGHTDASTSAGEG